MSNKRMFSNLIGHLADFHLVIWTVLVWLFSRFPFGYLALAPFCFLGM